MSFSDHNSSHEPTKLRSTLNTLMQKLSGSSLPAIESVVNNWTEIIDESFLPFCTPVSIHGECLTISVSDPALIQEIQWQSEKILDKVQPFLGSHVITEIKVSLSQEKPQ